MRFAIVAITSALPSPVIALVAFLKYLDERNKREEAQQTAQDIAEENDRFEEEGRALEVLKSSDGDKKSQLTGLGHLISRTEELLRALQSVRQDLEQNRTPTPGPQPALASDTSADFGESSDDAMKKLDQVAKAK